MQNDGLGKNQAGLNVNFVIVLLWRCYLYLGHVNTRVNLLLQEGSCHLQ